MNYKRLFIPNAIVFFTIVTNDRIPVLIENINVLIQSVFKVKEFYNFEIIAYSIQPEHIHCLLKFEDINFYPKIIKSFKYSFTRSVGLVKPTYGKIWQNRYWEHTIRDEKDLEKHLNYIHYNPVKHGLVFAVKDWEFSSFHKFVEKGLYEPNWGSETDIKDIINLNFE